VAQKSYQLHEIVRKTWQPASHEQSHRVVRDKLTHSKVFSSWLAFCRVRKKAEMNIEIRDAALEARIKKQLQATGSANVEEVLLRLLETQEEQDRWLLENREAIQEKIRRGIQQLDRGEGIPEEQLDAYLANLKAKSE
jgi:hypothetical protein